MLTEDQRKSLLISQVLTYVSHIQASDPGFSFPVTTAELKEMDVIDLNRLISELRRIAYIPPTR